MQWTSQFSSAAQLVQAKINVRADADACLVSKQVSEVLRNIVCVSSDPSIGCHVLPGLAQKLSNVSGETHCDEGANVPLIQHQLINSWGNTPAELLPAASTGRRPEATPALPGAAQATSLDHQQHLSSLKRHLSTTSNISQATPCTARRSIRNSPFPGNLANETPPGSSLGLISGLTGTYRRFLV